MTIYWLILGFVSVLALIYNFAISNNIILVGLFFGVFVALILALKYYYDGVTIDWMIVLKGAILGSIGGLIVSFFKRQ